MELPITRHLSFNNYTTRKSTRRRFRFVTCCWPALTVAKLHSASKLRQGNQSGKPGGSRPWDLAHTLSFSRAQKIHTRNSSLTSKDQCCRFTLVLAVIGTRNLRIFAQSFPPPPICLLVAKSPRLCWR